jgi:hypothetical protein
MYVKRPENTGPITKAFKAVEKGDNAKAIQIIRDMGLPEPEAELEVIVSFVNFINNSN